MNMKKEYRRELRQLTTARRKLKKMKPKMPAATYRKAMVKLTRRIDILEGRLL